MLKNKIQGNTGGLERWKGLQRGGCNRAWEGATERGRILARGAVSAGEMGQNTGQAMKLGGGKQQALTRMVLWLKRKAREDFLNNLLRVALGPAKVLYIIGLNSPNSHIGLNGTILVHKASV